jgi:hypothetical protein
LNVARDGAIGFLGMAMIGREFDDEARALLALGATKAAAADLMRRYPDQAALAQAVIDFASDGESDVAGALTIAFSIRCSRAWICPRRRPRCLLELRPRRIALSRLQSGAVVIRISCPDTGRATDTGAQSGTQLLRSALRRTELSNPLRNPATSFGLPIDGADPIDLP